MRKKREAKDEKEEEEKKKRVELRKAAAQAWLSHSQTSKRTVSEFEVQRRHGFVKGKASRFKIEALSSDTKHHHPSFLDWEYGQSLWDSYEIVSVSKKLERELTLEENTFSSYNGLKKKNRDSRNSLRSLFSRSSSRRFKQTHDVTPSNL